MSKRRLLANPPLFSQPSFAHLSHWGSTALHGSTEDIFSEELDDARPIRQSERLSESDLDELLREFAHPYLSLITQDQFIHSDCDDPAQRRHLGFHILMQVIYAAFSEASLLATKAKKYGPSRPASPSPKSGYSLIGTGDNPLLEPPKTIFAPETLAMDDFGPEKAANVNEPELETERENGNDRGSPILGNSFRERFKDSFGPSPSPPVVNETKAADLDPEALRNAAIREKYGSLNCVQTGANESAGLLGVGPFVKKECPSEGEGDESPSILKYAKRSVPNGVSDHEDDDFAVPLKGSTLRVNKKDAKKTARTKMAKNKFGMYVEEASLSQLEKERNLKQGNITKFLKQKPQERTLPSSVAKKPKWNEEDLDFELAIEASLKENQVKLPETPESSFHQAYDRLPLPKSKGNDEPAFKFKGSPVRTKSGKRLLEGVDCDQCRNYFECGGLSDEKVAELIQKCSKHRVKTGDNRGLESPQERWRVDINPDELAMDKTQVGSPLKTRAFRKQRARDLKDRGQIQF